MNITQITSPIPDPYLLTLTNNTAHFWMQLAALFYATENIFLGYSFITDSKAVQYLNSSTPLMDSWVAGNPAFVTRPVGSSNVYKEFVWGDVLKGVEEISHNVTAALLTLPLGTMNSTCSFDLQDVVYQYSSTAFWVPYGVSTFSLLSFHDLTLSPLCFIDVIGRCSNFAHFCRHDNGKK